MEIMKIQSTEIINIGEVSRHGVLRLDALFNIFQEKAILHTHRAGFGIKDLFEAHKTWILNRVAVEISTLPQLEDEIEVHTWSRKIYRFKGVREFEIFSDEESIVKASSLWVYFDAEKGRPVRVPDYFEDKFGTVPDQAIADDIETIRFAEITGPDFSLSIATRPSDWDINGHANNAAILQYIETGIVHFVSDKVAITSIQLVFQKEIPFHITQVTVLLERTDTGCLFEVQGEGAVFVRGTAGYQTG